MKVSAKNIAISALAVAKTDGVEKATAGLFGYLRSHNSLKALPLVLLEIDRAAEAEGVVMATVVSRETLDLEQKVEIVKKIKRISGASDISLKNQIDSRIIGGVRISFGDKVIDLTVKHQLDQLTASLANS